MAIGDTGRSSSRRKKDNDELLSKLNEVSKAIDKNTESMSANATAASKQAKHIRDLTSAETEALTALKNLNAAKVKDGYLDKQTYSNVQKVVAVAEKRKKGIAETAEILVKSARAKKADNAETERGTAATEKEAKAKKKSVKETKEQIAANKELNDGLKSIVSTLDTMKKQLDSGGIKVQINNSGFKRVLDEMSNAIDRFHERAEGATPRKKNFFDQLLGTRQENKDSGDELVKEAKTVAEQTKEAFISPLGKNLESKISNAIQKGIRSGVLRGFSEVSNLNPTNQALAGLAEGLGLSQFQKQRLLLNLTGKEDLTAIQTAKEKAEWDFKAAKYESREKTKRAAAVRATELDFAYNKSPDTFRRTQEARARRAEAAATREELALQKELNKEKRDAVNRERNRQEQVRIEREMAEVYGEEGSKIKKLGEELVLLQAKRRQIMIQGDELNKINFAELANNTRRIQETTRKWAVEAWNIKNHTEETAKRLKNMQTVYTRLASLTQTASAAISAASGLWSNMRSAATSFFRYFTNGFRRAFYYVRSLASNTLKAGIEQRQKIEQAQIGFASFFGEENVEAITRKVRNEAMKTPIVTAGSLAEYVQQLAPVSQGNASLAVNASLGILKSLVYSGSDISEGEYVIKNIRDVIAKGKATAIDIRQFNRALPGLEQALKESGQSAFLDKEGKLNITSKNVGQVLDLFAKLNTDENSPLKDIEEKQLRTLSGLEELFTEKRTSTMETILQKSGFFDLLYDVLGIATDDGKWSEIENVVSNLLKPVISKVSEFISSINWTELGNKIKAFFRVIGEGVSVAKDNIFGALGNVFGGDIDGVMKRFANIIKQFIIGFSEGVRDVINFVGDITKKLSGGNLEEFANKVGKFLVSPLGKLIQMLLGFSQNAIGALSRVFANIASMSKGLGDLWNWATKQGSTAYANRVVSNLKVSDMTAAQLQQALAGKAVTANGKDLPASAMAKLGKESALTTTKFQKIGDKLTTLGTAITRVAVKISSAVVAGGTINSLLGAFSTLIRNINDQDTALKNSADILDVLNGVLTGGVAGGMVGGVTGGLVGAVLGATVAIAKLRIAAIAASTELKKQKVAEYTDQQRKIIGDAVLEMLKAQGVNTDTGTDEGYYAQQRLIEYLNSQDPNTVNYHDAAMYYANALKFKKVAQGLYDYANSDEFNNMGGEVLDLKTDSPLRNELAETIRYFRLNGDYDSYGSSESIIKTFMNGDKITKNQAQALINLKNQLEDTESAMTTDLANPIKATANDITERMETKATELGGQIDASKDMTEGAITALKKATEAVNNVYAEMLKDDLLKDDLDITEIAKGINGKYGAGFFGGDLDLIAHSIATGHGLDLEGYVHDRDAYNPATSGMGDIASIFDDEGKEYNVFWGDIGEAVKKWLEDNGYPDIAHVPWTPYGDDFYRIAQEKDKWVKDTIGFMNEYRSKLPWLEEYLKKVILHKQIGGIINPIYRAAGGFGLGVDSVPAMLQPGEFVMRKASVDKAGLSTMFALNRGDMVAAARSLGSRFSNSYNNSRNWNSVVNNNQKTQSNYIRIFNRNKAGRVASYYSLANRIALA